MFMKRYFILGLFFTFFTIIPTKAQKQTTTLSSSTALDLMSKARKK